MKHEYVLKVGNQYSTGVDVQLTSVQSEAVRFSLHDLTPLAQVWVTTLIANRNARIVRLVSK